MKLKWARQRAILTKRFCGVLLRGPIEPVRGICNYNSNIILKLILVFYSTLLNKWDVYHSFILVSFWLPRIPGSIGTSAQCKCFDFWVKLCILKWVTKYFIRNFKFISIFRLFLHLLLYTMLTNNKLFNELVNI